jgi:hypothetical protein
MRLLQKESVTFAVIEEGDHRMADGPIIQCTQGRNHE